MNNSISLYLDEDTGSAALVRALRARGIDVISAQEAGNTGLSDADQLATALQEKRVICTFNTRDYVVLHTQMVQDERTHLGIIVSDQMPIGVVLKRLLRLVSDVSAEEMVNRLEFLSSWR